MSNVTEINLITSENFLKRLGKLSEKSKLWFLLCCDLK